MDESSGDHNLSDKKDKREQWNDNVKKSQGLDFEKLPYSSAYLQILSELFCRFHIYDKEDMKYILQNLEKEHDWCEATLNVPIQNPINTVYSCLSPLINDLVHERVASKLKEVVVSLNNSEVSL